MASVPESPHLSFQMYTNQAGSWHLWLGWERQPDGAGPALPDLSNSGRVNSWSFIKCTSCDVFSIVAYCVTRVGQELDNQLFRKGIFLKCMFCKFSHFSSHFFACGSEKNYKVGVLVWGRNHVRRWWYSNLMVYVSYIPRGRFGDEKQVLFKLWEFRQILAVNIWFVWLCRNLQKMFDQGSLFKRTL